METVYPTSDPWQDVSEWMGRWNHWTFTANLRKGQMDIFLNGSLYAAKEGISVRLSEILYLDIGHGWYGYYDGWIDDLRIYDYPLCQAEAAYLATDGSGFTEMPSSLQADLNGDGRIDWQDFALLAQDWQADPILY